MAVARSSQQYDVAGRCAGADEVEHLARRDRKGW